MKIFLSIFVLLSACGNRAWNYGESKFYSEETITRACDITLDIIKEKYPKEVKELEDSFVTLVWKQAPVLIPQLSTPQNPFFADGVVINIHQIAIYEFSDCIADTALSHELQHLVFLRKGGYPYSHLAEQEEYFYLMFKSNNKIREELCN